MNAVIEKNNRHTKLDMQIREADAAWNQERTNAGLAFPLTVKETRRGWQIRRSAEQRMYCTRLGEIEKVFEPTDRENDECLRDDCLVKVLMR